MVFLETSQLRKWVLDLASRAETFVWECIESRILSDDGEKNYISQYWTTLKNWIRQKKYYHQHEELGKPDLELDLLTLIDENNGSV